MVDFKNKLQNYEGVEMSERRHYTGLVRKSELTVEQVVDKIMVELDNTVSLDWYETGEEFVIS